SSLDTDGPVTTSVMASPNPATSGPSTVITLTASVSDATTGGTASAGAQYSTDNGATWLPMSASDGAFDEVTEDVTVTFTLGAAGLSSPGSYPILVRGTDAANQTGAAASTTLVVQGTAPTITSADHTTFTAGSFGTFTVTTSGTPTPSLSQIGALPSG